MRFVTYFDEGTARCLHKVPGLILLPHQSCFGVMLL
jgi:hypothetical protein